jgi:hypothetical protein
MRSSISRSANGRAIGLCLGGLARATWVTGPQASGPGRILSAPVSTPAGAWPAERIQTPSLRVRSSCAAAWIAFDRQVLRPGARWINWAVTCDLLFKASSETTLTIAADPTLMRSPRHAALRARIEKLMHLEGALEHSHGLRVYRCTNSTMMPSGPRMKARRRPGLRVRGPMATSAPFALSSAQAASTLSTVRPICSRP